MRQAGQRIVPPSSCKTLHMQYLLGDLRIFRINNTNYCSFIL